MSGMQAVILLYMKQNCLNVQSEAYHASQARPTADKIKGSWMS